MMPIALLCSGASLHLLEEKITDLAGVRFIWAGMNNYRPVETKILKKVGERFNYLYHSDANEMEEYRQGLIEFMYRRDSTFVTSHGFFMKMKDSLDCTYNCNVLLSNYANGWRLDSTKGHFNSLTAYLLTLISLGHKRIFIFGADGGGEYFDHQGPRAGVAPEVVQESLARDTKRMNHTIWQEISTVEKLPMAEIYNVSPASKLECFDKISIDQIKEVLNGSTKS